MIAYAARAVPWPLTLACCGLSAVLMAIVAAWPAKMWPLEGTTIGLLAGAAAWSMDETAAAVVDTLPRPLRWRTAARASALVPLAATWLACVLLARDHLPDHTHLFLLQGSAALLGATAIATWRRAHGSATPGSRFAAGAVAGAAMFALVRPFSDQLPLFPVWTYERWTLSVWLWSTLAVCSAVMLALVLDETRLSRWPGRRGTRYRLRSRLAQPGRPRAGFLLSPPSDPRQSVNEARLQRERSTRGEL